MRRFLRRFTAVVACLVTALAAVPAVAPPAVAAANTYTNPIKSQKGADPWLVFHDGNYYLISTTFTNTLVTRKSPTLAGLATTDRSTCWGPVR